MSQNIIINNENILHKVRLSDKISEIIEQIIARKVIQNTANEAGIKIEIEELQQTANQMRLVNNLINTEDTLA
jgi:ribosomal protein L32E